MAQVETNAGTCFICSQVALSSFHRGNSNSFPMCLDVVWYSPLSSQIFSPYAGSISSWYSRVLSSTGTANLIQKCLPGNTWPSPHDSPFGPLFSLSKSGFEFHCKAIRLCGSDHQGTLCRCVALSHSVPQWDFAAACKQMCCVTKADPTGQSYSSMILDLRHLLYITTHPKMEHGQYPKHCSNAGLRSSCSKPAGSS